MLLRVLTASYSSLSFYKEELDGETRNYICARASAELLLPAQSLRKTVEDTLESIYRVDSIAAQDPELDTIWQEHKQVLESLIHPSTPRMLTINHGNHDAGLPRVLRVCQTLQARRNWSLMYVRR